MTVWIIAIAMTAATLAALLVPLFRQRGATPDAADYDVEVYKDQLVQTNADYDAGLLTAEQATSAKTEISRRLLDADGRRGQEPGAQDQANRAHRPGWTVAAPMLVLVPVLALGFYTLRGSPGIPGQPYAERGNERAAAGVQRENTLSLGAAADKLAARLKKNPNNPDGWRLLARTYMSVQRFDEAAKSYARALGLDTGNTELRSAYGEALTLAADGAVTPAARAVFEEALRQSAKDPRARFYLALAAYQSDDKQRALDQWAALMRESAADAPWVPSVRQRIAEAATALGQDVAAATPATLPAQGPATGAESGSPGGPTSEQIEAAQNMSPEDRQNMIRAMVARLAEKLADNPRDFDGWMRLIRSYATLGEAAKAKAALAKAQDIFKNAPFPKRKLAQLAGELKLNGSDGGAAPGPSQEQVADAQEMSPEDRTAMIESMVARLATRLESEPGDINGWVRLARSYTVLKKPEKARDALAMAMKSAPSNTDILVLFARAARTANGGRDTTESLAALRKALVLAPNNIEALWFVGGAEAEAGDKDAALTLWRRALQALPEKSPERMALEKRIKALESAKP
ncbi:MAG: c-type cytochrome biogenesis protein CcmI [Rhodospirillaceae bacterium]|jgi:cytochrome c-type biogenesis protein CcmH|nr:c-type cytochrome biogenesis protein CcmI [Rhodospirillaceae bacterium]MBT5665601.1 c-type cytochrome biogenesis protein CcmI [Rhodospirillaceae bacterium]MBT5809676.1 c-type cytochrome biogenesis protein CcmI [Rhodospirillaceae bacterium]